MLTYIRNWYLPVTEIVVSPSEKEQLKFPFTRYVISSLLLSISFTEVTLLTPPGSRS